MVDETEDEQTETEPTSRARIDGEEQRETTFNPLDWGPDEAYSKVYDCIGDRQIWLGDLPGVPTQEHLASCVGPGQYMLMIRAGEACPDGKKKGTMIHPNFSVIVPGERTKAPTTVSGGMIAAGVADSVHVGPGAVDVRENPSPPAASSANNVLGEVITRLLAERSTQTPVTGVGTTADVSAFVELMLKLKQLQTVPGEVKIADIRGAFDEGEKLGDAKGYARASAEHGNGDGSGGVDIMAVITKVLETPIVQQMIKAASAPVVNLDDLKPGPPAEPSEGASHGP